MPAGASFTPMRADTRCSPKAPCCAQPAESWRPTIHGAEAALHEAILAAGSGDAAVGIKGIAVPLMTREGERYVAHVLPLTSGARRRTGEAMRQPPPCSCTRRRSKTLTAGSHCQDVQAHAERTARAARHCRGCGVPETAAGARHQRGNGEDASAASVCQDRHRSPGRTRQAGGRILQSARRLIGRSSFPLTSRHQPIGGRGAICVSHNVHARHSGSGGFHGSPSQAHPRCSKPLGTRGRHDLCNCPYPRGGEHGPSRT